jgi:hypothetical protein
MSDQGLARTCVDLSLIPIIHINRRLLTKPTYPCFHSICYAMLYTCNENVNNGIPDAKPHEWCTNKFSPPSMKIGHLAYRERRRRLQQTPLTHRTHRRAPVITLLLIPMMHRICTCCNRLVLNIYHVPIIMK